MQINNDGILFSKLTTVRKKVNTKIKLKITIMNSKNLIGGLLAGAAVGVAIGMLLAPASGKETKAKLVKGSNKLVDGLKETVEDSIESIKSQFNEAVDGVVKKGKETFNGNRDGVKA
jgi:gas vesicle protein